MSDVVALLLAAGGSRRMGHPKQLLLWQGASLVRRAAETALGSRCSELLVVLGSHAAEVSAELGGLPLRTCVNPDWAEGIASSLRTGVEALGEHADAVLVLLADQPKVDSALLDRLIVGPGAHPATTARRCPRCPFRPARRRRALSGPGR